MTLGRFGHIKPFPCPGIKLLGFNRASDFFDFGQTLVREFGQPSRFIHQVFALGYHLANALVPSLNFAVESNRLDLLKLFSYRFPLRTVESQAL